MKFLSILALVLAAGTAQAATITASSTAPAPGTRIELRAQDFAASGRCGSGGSVVAGGCSVALVSGGRPAAYDRFAPLGGDWIDSQDLADVTWTLSQPRAFTQLTFALTDAFDQLPDRKLGASRFALTVEGAVWTIPRRQASGTLHWLTVTFDRPTTTASLHFATRRNDGWGLSSASVLPATLPAIPLPAGGWLLPAALGMLGLVARRRRRA
ncbi:VPLPA-CTERM sorting domain-containing protein [Rubellimicrobium aerolatum]|uniref:VPLPA-CTERM sorting domain-containing protein n=1 Tax=Rubellimicrobium aerolatum TaxID=490979 RepID=A0ABW0S8S0_9RHOB|nr:VPLPA-CTERM sorting domain-containing protein [Rubellimicrobium aerolatum]MBP1804688.1 hypothetical protein [Rubellimicrobium aerolatum]